MVLGEFQKELANIYDRMKLQASMKGSLEVFMSWDKELSDVMEPVLNLKGVPDSCQELAKSLKFVLISLYNSKTKAMKLKKQSKLDEYFQEQVEYDMFRIVEPHVFFTFSYILVRKLEDLYQSSHLEYGYLNKLTKLSAVLYDRYKDSLQFEEDLQLYAKIKLDQFNRKKQNQFSDYVFVSQEIIGKLDKKAKKNSGYMTPESIIESVFEKWYESNTLAETPRNPVEMPTVKIWQKGKYESTVFKKMLQYMMEKNKLDKSLI